MRIAVLGPVAAERDGEQVDLGVRKQRALLAALALSPGRAASAGRLVDLLWGEAAPPGALATLHTYVAGLRRALEPERTARSTAGVLVTTDAGYALHADDVDAVRFRRLVADARRALGAPAAEPVPHGTPPDPALARRSLDEARALWRGEPYAELGDAPDAVAERTRLADLRLAAEELTAVVRLVDGEHAELAADLERLTADHPLRERLWGLRAVALGRSGRQAEALGVLRTVRELLADELGVDPGPDLQAVEAAVLRQHPDLAWTPPARPPVGGNGSMPVGRAALSNGSGPEGEPDPRLAPPVAWPLVGRTGPLARLTALLDEAEAGRPAFASVVGEPGIGKSRLAGELAGRAAGRGMRVLVGRCSQDEGAPPLWPWTAVLAGLPEGDAPLDPGALDGDPHGDRFRAWDELCRRLLAASADQPLLVVLDDLHWSDASSLRVLRHLVTTADVGRLAVVATWRRHPEPTGPLAEVAEALARRHALRVELGGLGPDEAAELLAAVTGAAVSERDSRALGARTEGNPFFLVEYARLLQHPDADLADGLPAAVGDVLARRLAGQPENSLAALRAAAVLGREVPLPVLADMLETDEDAVLDALDPALAAGLLVEDGVDRFRFGHALVRDAVYATLPLSRRARRHARAAQAWARCPAGPARAHEVARHWLAAGPTHAAHAWPAAVTAAREAMGLQAHEEARDLLRSAVDAQRDDAEASWRERYDVLMALVEACRRAADWIGLTAAVDEAVEVAEAAGDVERAARAAVGPSEGALWQARQYGVTHQPVVASLRRALDALPPGDGELRCRVMLALAAELYASSSAGERDALADEALAMARRIGAPDLLPHALFAAFLVTWRPATAEARLQLATEARDLAVATGDPVAEATADTLLAVALTELGRIGEASPTFDRALATAERLRLSYLLLVLLTMRAPWLALAGRPDEADVVLDRLTELAPHVALPQSNDGLIGAFITVRYWQGRLEEVLPRMAELSSATTLPITSVVATILLRLGVRDEAATLVAANPIDVTADDWFALLTWCTAGEVALGLGDRELAAAAYRRAAPYAGRVCSGGSGAPLGPVDAFLALAAAAVGETATATRHADRAMELCEEWQIPPVAQWLRDQRDRLGI